jgi:hypothetical protein
MTVHQLPQYFEKINSEYFIMLGMHSVRAL